MHNFKEGDWVRELDPLPGDNDVHQLTHSDFYGVGAKSSKYFKGIEHWKPLKDEWCWFFDNNTKEIPILAQFDCMSEHIYITNEIQIPFSEEEASAYGFNSCIPFMGRHPIL